MMASNSTPPQTFQFKSFTSADPIYNDLTEASKVQSFPQLTNAVRRSTRTLRNRLRSIHTDSLFVLLVAQHYGDLPLVTNARAGDWYVDPQKRAGSVYFKSTDGHTGEWCFSKRRLNLGLLEIASRNNGRGAIIVDSTRRGKRFPDSLSKTIPIWIAVINSALFPNYPLELHTPPQGVSDSEHSQISARVPIFLQEFLLLGLDLEQLRKLLRRPFRALFITPDSPLPEEPPLFEDFIPLVLVTASVMTQGIGTEGEYIQGAGDDHEGWTSDSGLTPESFWAYSMLLLNTDPDKLLDVIKGLDNSFGQGSGGNSNDITLIKPTSNIFISSRTNPPDSFGVVVDCCSSPLGKTTAKQKIIHLSIPPDKRGNKPLRLMVPPYFDILKQAISTGHDVLFVCDTGNDVAPAVALAVLCKFYNESGVFTGDIEPNKSMIKRRMAWINASRPPANPARGLLNAVNSILMC